MAFRATFCRVMRGLTWHCPVFYMHKCEVYHGKCHAICHAGLRKIINKTMWYHVVPRGTTRDHLGPRGTTWDHAGPPGTTRDHAVLRGPLGPRETNRYHAGPRRTTLPHVVLTTEGSTLCLHSREESASDYGQEGRGSIPMTDFSFLNLTLCLPPYTCENVGLVSFIAPGMLKVQ